ncbi:MAG: sulfite exporter TauE/SafE family protein [Eubacteriales bacterium]|nr:sulfite exporter TauE/SafE family protein [Eubacteriales bacterium]
MLTSFPVCVIVGSLLGFLTGMGVGGGSLLILWLTLVLGIDQSTARGINLLFFLPASAICCGFRLRQGKLSLRTCFPAIISGCIAAVLGSLAAASIDTSLLRKPFGILLLITGLRELFYRPQRRR